MKFFTYIKNITPEYNACIEHNMCLVPFTVFRICPYKIGVSKDIRNESDIARVMWLKDNPNWNWIDADCKIIKTPDFKMKPETAYMYSFRGQYDPCVIFGNGDKSLFEKLLKNVSEDVGWIQAYCDCHREQIGQIPEGYFNHMGLHKLLKKEDR